jgi:hypothetical protein
MMQRQIDVTTEKGEKLSFAVPTDIENPIGLYTQAWQRDGVLVFGDTAIPAREIILFRVREVDMRSLGVGL